MLDIIVDADFALPVMARQLIILLAQRIALAERQMQCNPFIWMGAELNATPIPSHRGVCGRTKKLQRSTIPSFAYLLLIHTYIASPVEFRYGKFLSYYRFLFVSIKNLNREYSVTTVSNLGINYICCQPWAHSLTAQMNQNDISAFMLVVCEPEWFLFLSFFCFCKSTFFGKRCQVWVLNESKYEYGCIKFL